MLGLQCETNEEWIRRVGDSSQLLLPDHAHCEKKAATMAISLLNNYPSRKEMVDEMSELAIEEMSHFSMVLKEIDERGIALTYDTGDHCAQSLLLHIGK